MARAKASISERLDDGYFQVTDQSSANPDIREPEQPAIPRIKRTYHLPNEAIVLLEELQLAQLKETGRKPELSELVAHGIRLLAQSRKLAS
jgi:hypothetical protein